MNVYSFWGIVVYTREIILLGCGVGLPRTISPIKSKSAEKTDEWVPTPAYFEGPGVTRV